MASRSQSRPRGNDDISSDDSCDMPAAWVSPSGSEEEDNVSMDRLTRDIRHLRSLIDVKQVKLLRLQHRLANLLHKRAVLKYRGKRSKSVMSPTSAAEDAPGNEPGRGSADPAPGVTGAEWLGTQGADNPPSPPQGTAPPGTAAPPSPPPPEGKAPAPAPPATTVKAKAPAPPTPPTPPVAPPAARDVRLTPGTQHPAGAVRDP